jgi:hypothetical protein
MLSGCVLSPYGGPNVSERIEVPMPEPSQTRSAHL